MKKSLNIIMGILVLAFILLVAVDTDATTERGSPDIPTKANIEMSNLAAVSAYDVVSPIIPAQRTNQVINFLPDGHLSDAPVTSLNMVMVPVREPDGYTIYTLIPVTKLNEINSQPGTFHVMSTKHFKME